MIRIMEVCGTHTMEIARAGIKKMLPPEVRLISGPGCPVCVTPQETIDAALGLADDPDVIITTYGDMMRVPGSEKGNDLRRKRANGSDVRVVYSPMDSLRIASENPDKQVVFLGVGFETTAPGTALTIGAAERAGIKNFSVFSMLKTVEPPIRLLAADPEFAVDGFLCPGHVAVIIGEQGLRFIPEELGIPAVIAGFEPEEILRAVTMLARQISRAEPRLENAYTRVVRPEGNTKALEAIERYLVKRDDLWRGMGMIERSGLGIREEFGDFDAEKRFGIKVEPTGRRTACRCGEVISGKIGPEECPLFGSACVPEDPEGPCMVSSEGACAAAYHYRDGGI